MPSNPRHLFLCIYLLLKYECLIYLLIFSFALGSNFDELILCVHLDKTKCPRNQEFQQNALIFLCAGVRKNHASEIQKY